MSNFQLKILACLFMVFDHVGYLFFPEDIWWRVIGRLSFPIFAFLIAEGYEKTSNIKRYFLRLLAFGAISQPIFQLAFNTREINIFLTLSLGLLSILLFDKIKNKKMGWFFIILASFVAHFLKFDYGAYGVLLIFSFWLYKKKEDFPKLLLSQFSLATFYILIERAKIVNGNFSINSFYLTQYIAFFALFFIYLYNGERGRKLKYLFYSFYPGHLLILAAIKNIFIK